MAKDSDVALSANSGWSSMSYSASESSLPGDVSDSPATTAPSRASLSSLTSSSSPTSASSPMSSSSPRAGSVFVSRGKCYT